MFNFITSIFGSIFGMITGVLGMAGGAIYSLLSSAIPMIMQYHQSGIAFARQVGLGLEQARAHSHMLTEDAAVLCKRYGIAASEVIELQKNIVQATGKQTMLTAAQREQMVQINKLLGKEFSDRISQTIMRDMGGSLDSIAKTSAMAYATAAKKGLSAESYSKKLLENLTMANRLTFQNGIRGVAEMTALSEKFNFNLRTIEQVADKTRDISDAITMSARLQSLGGTAAVYGSNPIAWMFESQSDAEGLTQRLINMTSGLAHFDRKSGTATWNGGYARELAREYANALGVSFEEFTKMAMGKANVTYKENNFKPILDQLAGNNKEMRDFLLNKMQVDEQNRAYMTDINGNKKYLSEYAGDEGRKELEKMMFYEGKSDNELMQIMAQELTSIPETICGFTDSIVARIASKIDPYIPVIHDYLTKYLPQIGDWIDNMINKLGGKLPKPETVISYIKSITQFVRSAVGWLKSTYNTVNKIVPVVKILSMIAAAAYGGRFINGLGRGIGLFGGRGLGGVLNRTTMLTAGRAASAATRVGAGLGYGAIGLGVNYAADHWIKDEKWKKVAKVGGAAATGAAIGSMIPVVGTAAGAIAGGLYGAAKQYLFNNDSKSSQQRTPQQGGGAYGGGVRYAGGGIVGTDVVGRVNSGEMILNPVQQSNLYNFINGSGNVSTPGYSTGGVVGGNSRSGDRIVMVGSSMRPESSPITPVQQSTLFNFISGQGGISIQPPLVSPPSVNLTTTGDRINNMIGGAARIENSSIVSRETNRSVIAAPVGERAEIRQPSTETGQHNVSVNDFNVNISGTIRIEGGVGGGNSVGISAADLLSDDAVIRQLKDIIKNSIASDMFSGRRMNDDAVTRGVTNAVTLFGR